MFWFFVEFIPMQVKKNKIEYSNKLYHVQRKEYYNKRTGIIWKKVPPNCSWCLRSNMGWSWLYFSREKKYSIIQQEKIEGCWDSNCSHQCHPQLQPSFKKDSTGANGHHAKLYLCDGADVMLNSNLWTDVGLNNGTKGKVVNCFYKDLAGPINGATPEAVVVQFRELDAQVAPFLPNYPNSLAIPAIKAEWKAQASCFLGPIWSINRKVRPLIWWWLILVKAKSAREDLSVTVSCA